MRDKDSHLIYEKYILNEAAPVAAPVVARAAASPTVRAALTPVGRSLVAGATRVAGWLGLGLGGGYGLGKGLGDAVGDQWGNIPWAEIAIGGGSLLLISKLLDNKDEEEIYRDSPHLDNPRGREELHKPRWTQEQRDYIANVIRMSR